MPMPLRSSVDAKRGRLASSVTLLLLFCTSFYVKSASAHGDPSSSLSSFSLPSSFDLRKVLPQCVPSLAIPGQCADAPALPLTEALATAICVTSQTQTQRNENVSIVPLSARYLDLCAGGNCNMGALFSKIAEQLTTNGTFAQICVPQALEYTSCGEVYQSVLQSCRSPELLKNLPRGDDHNADAAVCCTQSGQPRLVRAAKVAPLPRGSSEHSSSGYTAPSDPSSSSSGAAAVSASISSKSRLRHSALLSPAPHVAAWQQAIMDRGSIVALVDESDPAFQFYNGGVLTCSSSGPVQQDGALTLLGWGVTAGRQLYWIGQNTWGAAWGMDGYVFIADGSCGLGGSFGPFEVVP